MTETRTFDINQFITEQANDRAKSALASVLVDSDAFDAAGEVLELGLPLVVAAVLRHVAEVIAPQPGVVDGSDPMTRRACAAELIATAEALEFQADVDDNDTDGSEW